MRFAHGAAVALLVGSLVGCGSELPTAGSGGSDGTGGSGTAGGSGFIGAGGGSPNGCTKQAEPLYFATVGTHQLFRFDPTTKLVELLGTMDCSQKGGAHPYAIAVDRQGMVWAYWWGDGIYITDPDNLNCTKTAYEAGPSIPHIMSMAFALDTTDTTEHLYATFVEPDAMSAGAPQSFGRLEGADLTVSVLGSIGDDLLLTPLNGRADGKLFGMLNSTNEGYDVATIAELDKTSGMLLSTHALQTVLTMGWPIGFAMWGGDVWLIGAYFGGHRIVRYDLSSDTIETVIDDIPAAVGIESFSLVGGVASSVCAPLVMPN